MMSMDLIESMLNCNPVHSGFENALFGSTLRFLNCPCLALKQTERFQKAEMRFET